MADDFVFVEFDFTFGKSPEEQEREKPFRVLQKEYLITGFPTVVLADSSGLPYAIRAGYESGIGPKASLLIVRLAQGARKWRDEAFQKAKSLSGHERATQIHKGIQFVAPLLGSLKERGDDPMLVFYRDQIQEIHRNDDATDGPHSFYAAREQKRREWLERESVFVKLKEFDQQKDFAGAIDYLTSAIESSTDKAIRWRLERSRQVYLEWADRRQEALDNAQRLLKLPELLDEDREFLLDRESANLFALSRVDEAIAQCDRQIATVADKPKRLVRVLRWKAQMLSNQEDRHEQAIQAWRDVLKVVPKDSEDWSLATAQFGDQLQQAGRYRDALAQFEQFESTKLESWYLLDRARCHLQLGELEQATKLVEAAKKDNQALAQSERKSDSDFAAQVDHQIRRLEEELEKVQPATK